MSGISFDLNELLYARPDSEITARAIMNDFLDAKCKGLKDYDFFKEHLLSKSVWCSLKQKGYANKMRTRQNLRAFRTKSALTKDSVQISVPNLSNPKRGSSTLGRTDKLPRSFNKLRIDKKDIKGIRIAKSALKTLAILTMIDEKKTKEISKEIEATGTEKDPGFENEPLKDLKRGRTIGNYINNLLPIRLLAKQSTPAYGILSAFNDDRDDFLKLRAADPYLRAKELALFARSFLKELNECFEKLAKELKEIQGSLRLGLKDDRSLADKLYLAYKNVLKTTITRMNLAFTSTAAVADIRKAIAFATETSRPLAKAKADFDLDEEYECFIQDRQYFGGKKAAKAIKARDSDGILRFYQLSKDLKDARARSAYARGTLRQMLVKAYHSVGLVERYYVFVRRAFEIVTKELLKALKEDRL
ncbi:hypothetical protein MBM_04201 [Drepanopeziza brunnea f. sp. 'multigermtubi' MB_m1]|uniref:Uncharacterized protein n=1 Tax=Marssonina brunnea f. sp. multigermtubi (strain MB_m1) TaxID=1072389 RepID=K1WYY1_MARBU|nr:uncharacterized protein MBM_04201 [Drepanopeziza brunnea f. sp. 'multigermtubi' MB_m1]EKD17832.1 hypothetical protein MBM_04201 [Drepanopeziza brunnea f. sp. 'multigermtubi' MB_m1]